MDRYTYNCNYCGVEYTPRRRRIQKYCSNSCRVNAFKQRQVQNQNLPTVKKTASVVTQDKMSWSGVGNAAAGSLAVNLVSSLLTKEENKPATKGDIKNLLYGSSSKDILIKNVPPRVDGSRAYFNTIQQILIYKK
ncbi:hypothetical protein DZC78_04470 [Olleya aquimaris]|nr:hypothetical protein DZC78_04470 [Olleya aquimaris]